MAKVVYEMGLECKQCGNLIVSFDRHARYVLCEKCGTHLADFAPQTREATIRESNVVTVKVTHKLFHDVYEKVKTAKDFL